ncbi:MAG: hypothetical protein D6718_08430 [Acidobacteria bacterium]|nr:MAG: hypothetical protein D6718_08430 [Acidobacteriota bacterium]
MPREWLALAALAAGLAAAPGCAPARPVLEKTAGRFFAAVQKRDFAELARVDASAPPERKGPVFHTWKRQVRGVLDSYESMREEGRLEPDPSGYLVVRATMLGAGTYWETVSLRGGRRAPVLRIRLNFGYGEIPYGTLPAGTEIFLLAAPLGTIHRAVLGQGAVHEFDVLEHLDVEVSFARPELVAPGDEKLKVSRVTWLPDTARSRHVRWIF